MLKRLLKPTFVRALVYALLIAAQLTLMAHTLWATSKASVYIAGVLSLVSLFVVLYIVRTRDSPSTKLMWSILILLVPAFGGFMYLFFGLQPAKRMLRRRMRRIDDAARPFLGQVESTLVSVDGMRAGFGRQAAYLARTAGYPVYAASSAEYLASGEATFERLKIELLAAERYIFLEYFIIEAGRMWDAILAILEAKVAAGVEVYVMYDGIGCLLTLPAGYDRRLERAGIHCSVFNPVKAVPSALQNNRDHRKIVVIDGLVAFTGGVNLADEYINAIDRFGHWKDAAIVIRGDAVRSLATMFLSMWSLQTRGIPEYAAFLPKPRQPGEAPEEPVDGFVQPYADNPIDDEYVGEAVYLGAVNAASRYVYITTPYLVVDYTMTTALTLAAKSGVDVRIVTPRHWDKWIVHKATRSYYDELVSAGVKVYEYVDGFMHAKTFVSDDAIAVVGTTNLDYRSLYLHFECGVVLYGGRAVTDVRDDFIRILERCDLVAPGEYRPSTVVGRVFLQALRLMAPLL